MRASDGDSIPTESEIPATPDGGCLCYGLRADFYSSQGELLQVIYFSGESIIGDSKEIMFVLAILVCIALVAAGYLWRRELLEGEKTPHEKITKCVIILTSVVPRGLPMQMSLAVKAALMSLHSAGVFPLSPSECLWLARSRIAFLTRRGPSPLRNCVKDCGTYSCHEHGGRAAHGLACCQQQLLCRSCEAQCAVEVSRR